MSAPPLEIGPGFQLDLFSLLSPPPIVKDRERAQTKGEITPSMQQASARNSREMSSSSAYIYTMCTRAKKKVGTHKTWARHEPLVLHGSNDSVDLFGGGKERSPKDPNTPPVPPAVFLKLSQRVCTGGGGKGEEVREGGVGGWRVGD